ncbi:prolipoprotein diacylglyceryl transferase [Corallococcus sp. bb12-1]|uniref:prolipoprotein diacylglyceryl transferase family protein n=1 Tax=Corallococcus sp. bb12-1 TaxID=2996784 RepID=UPI00226DB2C5|nr:prolipoprotein diacylglyceryl transferase family protein [Corallococcus sp. bb12-1]MCY1039731.1 prolipoprotein diacylglyceryl transferase [Corallococcus sp. bb12-1]
MDTHFLHGFSPFLFRFSETLSLRWTGAAYLVGFLLVFAMLRRQAARGEGPFQRQEVSGFVLNTGLLGVMLGGRLGFVFLHQWEDFSRDGSVFFQFRQGGASALGAVLGVLAFSVYFARQQRRPWLQVTDSLAVLAPLGFLLGALAVFMEGAPLGQVTSVPWAVRFPAEVGLPGFLPIVTPSFDVSTLAYAPGHEVAALARADATFLAELHRILPARHPVLLYQAALEGLLLGGVLLTVRALWRSRPVGLLSGLFFALHGALALACLPFREAQPNLSFAAQLEQGVLPPVLMMAVGAAFLLSVLGQRPDAVGVPASVKLEG